MADEQNNYLPAIRQTGKLNKSDKGLIIRYQSPIKSCPRCPGMMYYDGIRNDLYCSSCRTREAVVGSLRRPRGSPGTITTDEACLIAMFAEAIGVRQVSRITGHSRDTIRKICRRLK